MTQLTFEDYDLTVQQVAAHERKKKTPQEVLEDFESWLRDNSYAMQAMYQHALTLAFRGKRVSAKYLVEWLRYEADIPIQGLPDFEYKVSNDFTPLISRYLIKRCDWLKDYVVLKPSDFDRMELPELEWGLGYAD